MEVSRIAFVRDSSLEMNLPEKRRGSQRRRTWFSSVKTSFSCSFCRFRTCATSHRTSRARYIMPASLICRGSRSVIYD